MKNKIITLSQKYDLASIQERMQDLAEMPSIKVGFIGEFSAGKSSLINSILSIKLPVSIKPTTKAICLIEPTEGIERNEYFQEINGERIPVSFMDFTNILRGEQENIVAVVKVKPSQVLPQGCIFVDTPGVHTVTGNEADLTYGYLAMLDAAVVCVNVTEGIINRKLLDFICSAQLRHLHKHMVFALTWADKKTAIELEQIRQGIITLLEKEIAAKRFDSGNIAAKVFPVSAMDDSNDEKVYTVLKNTVLNDKPTLIKQRLTTEYKSIAVDLLALLEEKLRFMSYDSSQIDAERRALDEAEHALNQECEKHFEKKEKFTDVLRQKINSILQSHSFGILSAKSEDMISAEVNAINQELVRMLNSETEQYLGVTGFNNSVVGNLGQEIHRRLSNIESVKNLSVTISTAVATAWLLPGASAAANAGEAAAGAAAKGAASGAVAAGAVAARKASAMSKIMGGIGTALKDINPLEHVGTFVANMAKGKSMEILMENKREEILANVLRSIEEPFEIQVLNPIRDKIKETRALVDELSQKDNAAFQEYKRHKVEMSADIESLREMLS